MNYKIIFYTACLISFGWNFPAPSIIKLGRSTILYFILVQKEDIFEIMQLSFSPFILNFKRPFKIAHGVRTSTPVVFTELTHDGYIGYGEASMPPYLGEDHQTASLFLEKAGLLLKQLPDPFDTETILKAIDAIETGNNAAKAAVDIALHDLQGKLLQKTTREHLNIKNTQRVYTTYTIGVDEPDVVKQKIKEGSEYSIYKVKLTGVNDKEMVETIRSVTDKPIAIDVNQGWNDKYFALDFVEWLYDKNVLWIEQPFKTNKPDDMGWLKERIKLPLLADESCKRLADIEKVKDVVSGINIKLMKCTGIHEALKMITRARELDLKILIGCMSESSCGVSAAAQLASACDWADLDGPLLIANDVFDGVVFNKGEVVLNDLPGIGVSKKI